MAAELLLHIGQLLRAGQVTGLVSGACTLQLHELVVLAARSLVVIKHVRKAQLVLGLTQLAFDGALQITHIALQRALHVTVQIAHQLQEFLLASNRLQLLLHSRLVDARRTTLYVLSYFLEA
jgi:hypothetical protein